MSPNFSPKRSSTIAIHEIVPQLTNVRDHAMTAKEKVALLSLLDDPSPAVRGELLKILNSMGSYGLEILNEAAKSSNRLLGWHAGVYLSKLRSVDLAQELRKFIRSGNYELETGWMMISRVAYPNLEIGSICNQLDSYASRCKELIIKPASSRDQCAVINRVLFHEAGFRGNSEQYTDPDNSFINAVLRSKKGLPITLSVLYLLIAERLGLEIAPINAPGHFVVGCFEETAPFYIDPFEHGKFLTAGHMLKRIESSNIAPNLSYLAPATIHETLSRICRNLVFHYTESGKGSMAALFSDMLEEFKEAYEKQL